MTELIHFLIVFQERLVVGEVERTDSGVGSETSKPSKLASPPSFSSAHPHRALTRVTTVSEDANGTSLSESSGGGLFLGLASVGGLKEPEVPLCEDCEAHVETRVTSRY